jgi:hypothetical protein
MSSNCAVPNEKHVLESLINAPNQKGIRVHRDGRENVEINSSCFLSCYDGHNFSDNSLDYWAYLCWCLFISLFGNQQLPDNCAFPDKHHVRRRISRIDSNICDSRRLRRGVHTRLANRCALQFSCSKNRRRQSAC